MLIKTVQLLLSLSILVLIHEFGHFIAARMFKTRVEKFYLFFDFLFPIPTLLNFAIFKKKIGDTEYGLGWFPLGGYVKIAGMADESMDDSYLNSEPKPDEYRSKKNWQKLIIMLGGIIMNVLLGWLIYSQLLFWMGETYLPAEEAKYGISCDSVAMYGGFRDGDIILSHSGDKKFDNFNSIATEILLNDVTSVNVLRDGAPHTVNIPADFIDVAVASRAKKFIDYQIPCIVGEMSKETVIKGKLKEGDRIIALNDSTVTIFQDAPKYLVTLKGKEVAIKFIRANDTLVEKVVVPATGLLGFRPSEKSLNFVHTEYNLFHSFTHGATVAYKRIVVYLKQFKLIFRNGAYKQLGGVGTMGSLFPPQWDWVAFWQLTAFISLMLAIMNLLPIPMLDGGYVILLLAEMLTGRKISDKVLDYINRVGFFILIGLMIYANGMDIVRHFLGK